MSDTWDQYLESADIPVAGDPGGHVIILSAHPDDEVLAVGAWIAAQRHRRITFVTATDGEASHPGSPTRSRDDLRRLRPRELAAALRRLGIRQPDIRRLGLPDGALATRELALDRALAPLIATARLVLTPFEQDGHPDHDAIGAAAARLCTDRVTHWQFPIWTWAWTSPGNQPWLPRLRRLPSTPEDRHRKRKAIDSFATQVRPLGPDPADRAVVDGPLLRHAQHGPEVVVT